MKRSENLVAPEAQIASRNTRHFFLRPPFFLIAGALLGLAVIQSPFTPAPPPHPPGRPHCRSLAGMNSSLGGMKRSSGRSKRVRQGAVSLFCAGSSERVACLGSAFLRLSVTLSYRLPLRRGSFSRITRYRHSPGVSACGLTRRGRGAKRRAGRRDTSEGERLQLGDGARRRNDGTIYNMCRIYR